MFEIAFDMAFCLCVKFISGVLMRMLQKIKLYSIITSERHNTIHRGTKMISHDQFKKPSNFSGIKTNCSALTDKKSSISNDRSFCLIAHMQKNTLTMLETISGTKTKIQRCFPFVSLSHNKNSNINKMRCRERLISIDLN